MDPSGQPAPADDLTGAHPDVYDTRDGFPACYTLPLADAGMHKNAP